RGVVDFKGEFCGQAALAEKADAGIPASENSCREERLDGDRGVDVELLRLNRRLNAGEIHLVVLDGIRLIETALRQSPVDRHLAALEARFGSARARGLTLAAAPPGLAESGADAPAEPLARAPSPAVVGNLIE